MELQLIRTSKTAKSTIGTLSVNGKFECFVLEDTDRGLSQGMSLELIKKIKVYAKTAIPAGRYQVVINWSNRFKQYMPLLIEVPGYEGVRIHSGNTPEASAGCLLTGQTKGQDFVGNSKKAFQALYAKLKDAEKKEKIFITIQ